MKILGIDYGTKRIGLAISDETKTLARELSIVPPNKIFNEIINLHTQDPLEAIVLGYPLSVRGDLTEKTKEVLAFQKKLETKTGLPVHLADERFSSAMAQNLPGGRQAVDSLAAQIILQNYLYKIKNSQNPQK